MVQSSRSRESSRRSGSRRGDSKIFRRVHGSRSRESRGRSGSIVVEKIFFGRWMITSGVEAIGWGEDLPGIEHASKQLSQERAVLAGLFGQFFGAKWAVR